jgi:NADPH-dependent ferric siderophore reductase
MVALRPRVREHGLEDAAMYLKGYWNLGRVALR